jgi:hypothetical protein
MEEHTVNIQTDAGAIVIIETGITAGYQQRKLPIKCSNDNFNETIIVRGFFFQFSLSTLSGSVVGSGTMLNAERSRVRIPMR